MEQWQKEGGKDKIRNLYGTFESKCTEGIKTSIFVSS